MNQELETVIMFSGGQDSTVVTCELLKRGHKVRLLMFNNGICIRVSKPLDRINDLIKKFGTEKIKYAKISSSETLHFLRENSLHIFRKYKSPLIFDLICRLAMDINTIIYCKKNNLTSVADGNNIAQAQIFMQQKEYLDIVDDLYKQYGIDSIHPIFFSSLTRETNRNLLIENGLHEGCKFFEKLNISSQLLNQPFCLWAPMAFLFTSPLRKLGFEKLLGLSTTDAIEIRKSLHSITKKYIDERL